MQTRFVVSIPTLDTHPVIADWYPALTRDGEPSPHLVIMCHGFKGYRRWGFIPLVALRLQDEGFGALVMDFSHNGRVPEDGQARLSLDATFVAPALFRNNTIARELDDLSAVIAWVRGAGPSALGIPVNPRIALWGHSRGGLVAAVKALEDPSIAALATWSALAHPQHYTERQKKLWRDRGELVFTDYATGTSLALGLELLEDMEKNRDRYAVGERAEELTTPHLVVHGEHDPTVPVAQSYTFYDTPTIKADKKLLRLLTGHTYGYDDGRIASEALENATRATVEWFDSYLRGSATDG
ncbi:MAG: prolyl oligopeptidase family serine peptidase [Candidatus Krumholzibacteria bacterium]|nr:prolyl oligopeptidase family serine peptidase [Candidatus Krumholzibacteria bacterium]MDH4338168.1 prolyl oligopeptidase family serine peptidase [Candidatus Krumholzibacteria bacterium]MDH5269843.1 prolyl oligopeptidase family serine peptidase [Candidatus Krumholzibacteria bacterium]